jgi:hypothetical protein
MEDRRYAMAVIKAKVQRGDYTVDPGAVADALLLRLRRDRWERLAQCDDEDYTECSYPRSRWFSASTKWIPTPPRRTFPIQLSVSLQLRAAASAITRAGSGTQTQSS